MSCPYLEYRRSDDTHEFDHDRPYCALAEEFVSPMKADVCNDRDGFTHDEFCEIFQNAAPEADASEDAAREEVVSELGE